MLEEDHVSDTAVAAAVTVTIGGNDERGICTVRDPRFIKPILDTTQGDSDTGKKYKDAVPEEYCIEPTGGWSSPSDITALKQMEPGYESWPEKKEVISDLENSFSKSDIFKSNDSDDVENIRGKIEQALYSCLKELKEESGISLVELLPKVTFKLLQVYPSRDRSQPDKTNHYTYFFPYLNTVRR